MVNVTIVGYIRLIHHNFSLELMGNIVSNTISTPNEMNNSYKELSNDLF